MVIRSKRFRLRDFTEDDRSVFLAYHADPRYLAQYGLEGADPDHVSGLLQTFELWASERPRRNYQLAVVELKGTQALVGCCGLRRAGCSDGRAELGIELAPEHWGRYGFAVEIAGALMEFGFRDLELREMFGVTTSANTRISRLATWFGATEGVRRAKSSPMQACGWNETEWRISRKAWDAGRARSVNRFSRSRIEQPNVRDRTGSPLLV